MSDSSSKSESPGASVGAGPAPLELVEVFLRALLADASAYPWHLTASDLLEQLAAASRVARPEPDRALTSAALSAMTLEEVLALARLQAERITALRDKWLETARICNAHGHCLEASTVEECASELEQALAARVARPEPDLVAACEDLIKVVQAYGYTGGSLQRAQAALAASRVARAGASAEPVAACPRCHEHAPTGVIEVKAGFYCSPCGHEYQTPEYWQRVAR